MKYHLVPTIKLTPRGFSHHLLLPLIAIVAVGSIGAYLTFSSDASTARPAKVVAVGGGDSIAVMWKSMSDITRYNVYRDGKQVGTVAPKYSTVPAYQSGTRYIDRSITKGKTYKYTVQAVMKSGRTSAMSASTTGKVQKNGMTTPAIATSSDSDPRFDGWVEDAKQEMRIWYPKLSDKLATGKYTPPKTFQYA